jgi:hypothetical protein
MQSHSAATRATIVALEQKFWKAIVDEDTGTATSFLTEPAFMVSGHGAFKFDHAVYRKMAEQGSMVIKSFELSDMDAIFPSPDTVILSYKVRQVLCPRGTTDEITQDMTDTSVWVRQRGEWRCAMHTETPVETTGS